MCCCSAIHAPEAISLCACWYDKFGKAGQRWWPLGILRIGRCSLLPYASPYHLGAEILVNDGQPTTFAPVWEPETIVTQRVIRPSYFYTFSTLCGKFMLLLAQALHAVCPGIVVISGIWPSYKHLYYPESTLSIRFEIVWSVWLSVLGNPWYLVLFRLCCVQQTCLYLRIFYALCRVVSASGLRF